MVISGILLFILLRKENILKISSYGVNTVQSWG